MTQQPDQPGWTSPGAGSHPGGVPPGQQWQRPATGGAPPPPGPPPGAGPAGTSKTGVIPLRPIGLGEILDGAVTYIRRYPKATLGLAAIVAGVPQAIVAIVRNWLGASGSTTVLNGSTVEPAELARSASVSIVTSAVTLIVVVLAVLLTTGMLTSVVGQAVLGRQATIASTWRQVRPRIWSLLGNAVAIALMILGAFLVCLGPGILVGLLATPAGGALLGSLGILLWIPAVAWIYVTFAVAVPAVVLERQRVSAALGRSRRLVRGSWWRVSGILLLAGVITFFLRLVLLIPFGLLQSAITVAGSALIGQIVAVLGTLVATAIVSPFNAGVTALLYVDLRMRREGFDLQLQHAVGLPSQPPPNAPPGAPPPYGSGTGGTGNVPPPGDHPPPGPQSPPPQW